jgi:hypothetical protein
LINSTPQHSYIANADWMVDFGSSVTPTSWFNVQEIGAREKGPFIVKGRTNSRKNDWNRKMFAPNKEALGPIIASLMEDPLISMQDIVIREYIPLKTILTGINGLPITYEFRVFMLGTRVLSIGYYWSSYLVDIQEKLGKIPSYKDFGEFVEEDFDVLIEEVRRTVTWYGNCNFYTIDLALTEKNRWILIELNDGQMAGLSENDPNELYCNLAKAMV